jgi:ubiquinone/menaquinone biosynthesis C-methylase UbiE
MKDRQHDLRANRSYHERVAPRYDAIYKGPRWDAWYEVSWEGLKAHLPRDLRAPVVDLGCGTGRYGLRLAKSGFTVTLSDLAENMLEAARLKAAEMGVAERCTFLRADVMDLGALPREHFALALAQGDVLSFATHPPKALKEVRKLLQPGGILVASVDQTYAAIAHYAEKADLAGLARLLGHGEMEWLAHEREERFTVHTFTAEELRGLLESAGFEVLDLFGKTVLPFKKLEPLFEDPAAADQVLALEKKLCRKPSALGLASHLQFTARLTK